MSLAGVVVAPANPLRGVGVDAAYVTSVLAQIDGPVLLVGHSYGGAVISNAQASNVVGLVFVAAFAPDADEVLRDVAARSKDSVLNAALVQRTFPTGEGGATAVGLIVDPATFRETFAADLLPEQAAVLAASQRPIAADAFASVSGKPTWRSVPSWAVVTTGDKAAGADLVRTLAERAGADTIELEGSHVILPGRATAAPADRADGGRRPPDPGHGRGCGRPGVLLTSSRTRPRLVGSCSAPTCRRHPDRGRRTATA